MSNISLRAYLQKIEQLVEDGRLSDAIKHAQYILQQKPQNIDTYRIYGRALLELREQSDAADLFQRVLSAEPNDFVSHIGLSEIYRDQGLTGQSIWHLERAYEMDPYNGAIQKELKSLYRTRDNITPNLVPLTDAALARLHHKGNMYQQAATELRLILHEDPSRIDLEALLAEALWRDNQRVQAVDVCLALLDRLPNCITVNGILAEIWLLTGRVDEAQQYLQRLRNMVGVDETSLDVESPIGRAFLANGAPRLVPNLLVDFLDEGQINDFGLELTGMEDSPDMVDSGLDEEYDWLGDFVVEVDEEGGGIADSGDSPDFLQDAANFDFADADEANGWLDDLGFVDDSVDETVENNDNEIADIPSSINPDASVPDWLSNVAAEDSFEPVEMDESEIASLLQSENDFSVAKSPDLEGGDDWLSTLRAETGLLGFSEDEPDEISEPEAAEEPPVEAADEGLDWLMGSDLLSPLDEPSQADKVDLPESEPLELDDFAEVREEGVPAWLMGSDLLRGNAEKDEAEGSAPLELDEMTTVNEEGIPDWLMGTNLLIQSDAPEPAESAPLELDDFAADGGGTPDWLMGSDLLKPVEDEEFSPDDAPVDLDDIPAEADETPDWLLGTNPLGDGEAADDAGETAVSEAETSKENVPNWLLGSDLLRAPDEAESDESYSAPDTEAEALPDWLDNNNVMDSERFKSPEDTPLSDDDQTDDSDGDQFRFAAWLDDLDSGTEDEVMMGDDQDKKKRPEQDGEEPHVNEELNSEVLDEAMNWLEDLAEDQLGSENGEEVTEVNEAESAAFPDWLAELGDAQSADAPDEVSSLSLDDALDLPGMDDALAWLDDETKGDEASELPTLVEETAVAEEADDILSEGLSWLDELGEAAGSDMEEPPTLQWLTPADDEGREESLPDLADSADVGDALDWLEGVANEESEEDLTPLGDDVTELPLLSDKDLLDSTAEENETEEIPTDLDDAMAWLEELAGNTDSPVEELPTVAEDMLASRLGQPEEPDFEAMVEQPAEVTTGELDGAMAWLDDLADADDVAANEADVEDDLLSGLEIEPDEGLFDLEFTDASEPEPVGTAELSEAIDWLESLATDNDESEATLPDLPTTSDLERLDLEVPQEGEALLEVPESVDETLPDWLENEAESDSLSEMIGSNVEEEAEIDAALDELELVEAEVAEKTATAQIGELEEELDDAMAWLEDVTDEAVPDTDELLISEGATVAELSSEADDAMAWLDDLTDEPDAVDEIVADLLELPEAEVIVDESVDVVSELDLEAELDSIELPELDEAEEMAEAELSDDVDEVLAETDLEAALDALELPDLDGIEETAVVELADDADDAMAWLEDVADEPESELKLDEIELPALGVDEETAVVELTDDADDAMAWLEDVGDDSESELKLDEIELPALDADEEQNDVDETVAWLDEMAGDTDADLDVLLTEEATVFDEEVESLEIEAEEAVTLPDESDDELVSAEVAAEMDDAMSWLSDLAGEHGLDLDELMEDEDDAALALADEVTLFDDLIETDDSRLEEAALPDEPEAEAEIEETTADDELVSAEVAAEMDDAMSWLSDLADEHGLDLDELMEDEDDAALALADEVTLFDDLIETDDSRLEEAALPDELEAEAEIEETAADDELVSAEVAAEMDDAMSWLSDLADEHGLDLDELMEDEDDASLALADEVTLSDALIETDDSRLEEAALPDELEAEAEIEETTADDELVSAEVAAEMDDAMSWLSDLAGEHGLDLDELMADEASEPEVVEAKTSIIEAGVAELGLLDDAVEDEDPMAWLDELAGESDTVAEDEPAVVVAQMTEVIDEPHDDPPTLVPLVLSNSLVDALNWLESEAEREGEDLSKVTLLQNGSVPPANDLNEALEWLARFARGEETAVSAEPIPINDELDDPFEDVDSESNELAAEPDNELVSAEVAAEMDDAMSWLSDLAGEHGLDLDELMSEQEEAVDAPEAEAETGSAESRFELVDELPAVEETPNADNELVSAEVAAEMDDAMSWLSDLAGEHGLDLEELMSEQEEVADVPEAETIVADELGVAEAAESDDELVSAEVAAEMDDAMSWLNELADEHGLDLDEFMQDEEPEIEAATEEELPADQGSALEWLDQFEAADEPEDEESIADILSDNEDLLVADLEEDFGADLLADLPEDPDQAIAWLSEVAAEQEDEPIEEVIEERPSQSLLDDIPDLIESLDDDLDLPETTLGDIDDSWPEWLGEGGERPKLGETGWLQDVGEPDVLGWLEAEEEAMGSSLSDMELLNDILSSVDDASELTAPLFDDSIGDKLYETSVGLDEENIDKAKLESARQAMAAERILVALERYQTLISEGEGVGVVIADLEAVTRSKPQDADIRRMLGDAYMQSGQLQRALDTYRLALDHL